MTRNIRKSILVAIYSSVTATLLFACSSAGSADMKAAANTPSGRAISLVSERAGAAPEEITVLSEEAVDFSDSSLGCPKPGMAYMQVVTPGHKVMLEYEGKTYDVRIAGGRGLICEPQAEAGAIR